MQGRLGGPSSHGMGASGADPGYGDPRWWGWTFKFPIPPPIILIFSCDKCKIKESQGSQFQILAREWGKWFNVTFEVPKSQNGFGGGGHSQISSEI